MYKEMPLIPVNNKIIIGKMAPRRRGIRGC
jgi:hypothetical protein